MSASAVFRPEQRRAVRRKSLPSVSLSQLDSACLLIPLPLCLVLCPFSSSSHPSGFSSSSHPSGFSSSISLSVVLSSLFAGLLDLVCSLSLALALSLPLLSSLFHFPLTCRNAFLYLSPNSRFCLRRQRHQTRNSLRETFSLPLSIASGLVLSVSSTPVSFVRSLLTQSLSSLPSTAKQRRLSLRCYFHSQPTASYLRPV
jgi:hypothetical protein